MKILHALVLAASALVLAGAPPAVPSQNASAFRLALSRAERALESGDLEGARKLVQRALERGRRSPDAWALRARWAKAAGELDEQVYATHQRYRYSLAQGAPQDELDAMRAELLELDAIAIDLLGLKDEFLEKLNEVATRYEDEDRPHSAIRVHKRVLSLDPENEASQQAIERIASAPDPSLAGEAKPKDLFADVTDEWIAEFDAEHADWDSRAKIERDNYITYTDAGYEVLVRVAEAMEQMNAFYRVFFQHGTEEHGGSVPRIAVHIFKNRDEYLELGIGPPVEWSGGHFTGSAVETYIPGGAGFEGMTGTLFHEAAHQFVSLATNASGWLNEGLASFFEGTEMLPNGTVVMNLPADHRLFPLAARMEQGWMRDHEDGISASDPGQTPTRAPRFRTVLENKYSWGPPWYAPTWGVVYFLYNYQDPVDGRYVYRAAFQEFIDKSGGRVGEGAVSNFEEVVLANPMPPLKGVDREGVKDVRLPRTVEELDDVWKAWCLQLRDERRGKSEVQRPWKMWGRYARMNKNYDVAFEHFEKGLLETPEDPELLVEFAELLRDQFDDEDRASKLALDAIRLLERQDPVDARALRTVEKLLGDIDPQRKTLVKVEAELADAARAIVGSYKEADLPMMVMDVSWRLGSELGIADLFKDYEDALRKSGKTLDIWELAYNEESLEGWTAPGQADAGQTFAADGSFLSGRMGTYDPDRFDFQTLTLDRVTSGDFSMKAEVSAEREKVSFAGFVFGLKDPTTFHGYLVFPARPSSEGAAETGYADLMSSFGGQMKTWRHVPVATEAPDERSTAGTWHTIRLDVSGRFVDLWFDDQLVTTHEFANKEILRGRFGLVTGPGSTRFRDVRFLARDPRDPGAAIQRNVRVTSLREAGTPINGSYQGLLPPFPEVARWVQGERSSWQEAGRVPQLLTFFSIEQNEKIGIDEWLTDLAATTEELGMEFVSICSVNNDRAIESFLEEHPLPGSVAVDLRAEDESGIGQAFEQFFIRRFNLPRLLLIDIDQTVAWEGDPGFSIGTAYDPALGSYLDDPLEELIAKHNLRELIAWQAAWESSVVPAMARGDLGLAIPALAQAKEFNAASSPEVATAQGRYEAVVRALDDLEGTAEALREADAVPALEALIAWGELIELPVDEAQRKKLRKVFGHDSAKDWNKVPGMIQRHKKGKKDPPEKAEQLLKKIERLDGAVAQAFAEDLRSAHADGDYDEFERLVDDATQRPGMWLAAEYFGW